MPKYRIPEIFLGVMLAVVIFAMGMLFSSQPIQSPEQSTVTANSEQHHSRNPFVRFWNWTTHDPVAFYTFVLALFTGVLGVVAIVQIIYLRRADETARISADAAKKSADAAKASIEISKFELRAELTLKTAVMKNLETIPQVDVELINSGRSTARNVSFWLTMGFRPIPPPDGAFKKPREIATSLTDLGSQRTVTNSVVFQRQPSKEEIDLLKTPEFALFVFGEATYTDSFGDRHTLPVRLATGGPYGALPANGSLALCEEGNAGT